LTPIAVRTPKRRLGSGPSPWALANDSARMKDENAVKVFTALAATVTLLQQRKRNAATAEECIILAVE
jgi:hypothetical protein